MFRTSFTQLLMVLFTVVFRRLLILIIYIYIYIFHTPLCFVFCHVGPWADSSGGRPAGGGRRRSLRRGQHSRSRTQDPGPRAHQGTTEAQQARYPGHLRRCHPTTGSLHGHDCKILPSCCSVTFWRTLILLYFSPFLLLPCKHLNVTNHSDITGWILTCAFQKSACTIELVCTVCVFTNPVCRKLFPFLGFKSW